MGLAAAVALACAGSAAWADEPKGEGKPEAKGEAKPEAKGEHGEHHGEAKGEHGEAKGEHGEAKGEHGEHGEHEGRLEVSFTERPLTLPKHILNLEGEFGVEHLDNYELHQGTSLAFTLSGRFGITDDLEVSAIFAPFEVGPYAPFDTRETAKFKYANPRIGATYRFLSGKFELGATLGLTIVHQAYESAYSAPAAGVAAGVIVEPGLVYRLHISKEALLFGGVYVPIEGGGSVDAEAPGPGNTFGAGLRVPISFAYDLFEPLHVGVNTGIGLASSAAPAGGSVGENFYIPLGAYAGYAVGGKDGPILDIDPFFNFPHMFTPGSQAHAFTPAHTTRPNDFSVGIALGGFLYL
jgi:hypothetical protein